jgi:hypothetical protein
MRDELKRLDIWNVPEQWSQIERRVPREMKPDPPHRSRAVAGLVAVAVAIAGLGFAFVQLRGLGDDRTSPGERKGIQFLETTERTIDTGLRFPQGAAAGYGSVWVATGRGNAPGGDLLRLDPSTGDETARIPMSALPGWTFGGAGITTGLDAVWIVAEGTDQPAGTTVYRVDPVDADVPQEIPVGPGSGADVWVDESGIWVLAFSRGNADQMILYRLDPDTYEITHTTTLAAGWSQTVFGAGGWIYVWASTRGTAPAETLFRIDPANGHVMGRSQPGGGAEFSLIPSDDRIWYFHEGLRALDAATGDEVIGPLDNYSTDWAHAGSIVADGAGGVWAVEGSITERSRATLVHLDRNGRVVASTGPVLGQSAQGIAATYDPASSSLWIVHYEETVTRFGLVPTSGDPGVPQLFFPTVPGKGSYEDALYRGPLLVRDDCLILGEPGDYMIPIWPDGFTAERDASGRLVVGDADGNPVAIQGEIVEMGGGYVAEFQPRDEVEPIDRQLERVTGMIGERIPERCLQPDVYGFWLVGETQPISP